MKKKLIIGLSAIGLAAATIGGAYAFLTDAEEAENVFTIGNVDISLLSNQELGEEVRLMPNNNKNTKVNYAIENIGQDDAYVWLRVKVPVALEDEGDASKDNILHWNFLGAFTKGHQSEQKYIDSARALGYEVPDGGVAEEDTWTVTTVGTEVIDEIEYNVYDLLYTGAITPGEITNIGVSTVYIDERVDYVNGGWVLVKDGGQTLEEIDFDFYDGANFIVEGHAIQKDGFKTVEEAYAAYNTQWGQTETKTKLAVMEEPQA